MNTRYEYFQGRFNCYIAEAMGISLIALGVNASDIGLGVMGVLGGFALYGIGRDTSDRLVQEELRGKKSQLEQSVEQTSSVKVPPQ